jgi:hypothetical protein
MKHSPEQTQGHASDLFRPDRPLVTPQEEKTLRDDIRAIVRESGLPDAVRRARGNSEKNGGVKQTG